MIPGCSELESGKGTDTELENYINDPLGTSTMGARQQEEPLRELSGRSRAILKQYFEAEDPYTFPVGHRTVAFTEPQIYHLLRVLTDEAISMTCTTMEQMVIGAVKGKLATAPSRTGPFKSRARHLDPIKQEVLVPKDSSPIPDRIQRRVGTLVHCLKSGVYQCRRIAIVQGKWL